jgi:transcriptional regulator with XRE-family HTH domain
MITILQKNFSTRIVELRKDTKLSQTELGRIVGLSQDQISVIERGKALTNMETLIALADFFDVSLDYLCGRSESRERLP